MTVKELIEQLNPKLEVRVLRDEFHLVEIKLVSTDFISDFYSYRTTSTEMAVLVI